MKNALLLLLLFHTLRIVAEPLPHLIPYRDGDKWGYCDSAGIVKILPQWDEAEFFYGNKAIVKMNDRTGFGRETAHGLIDTAGHYIIPVAWHWNRTWRGLQQTMLNAHDSNNRYGLVDTNGRLLLPFAYDMPSYFRPTASAAYRIVGKDGRIGLISAAGEVLIPFRYQSMEEITVATDTVPLFRIMLDGTYGVVDRKGNAILPAEYMRIDRLLDTGNAYQRRSGFQLLLKALNDRHDSAKGMKDIYGWMDYPGTTFIAPQYGMMIWIAHDYFVGDDHLYRVNERLALPKAYRNIYAVHDTIFASRTAQRRKDSILVYQYAFKAKNLDKLFRREVWTPTPGNGRAAFYCGTSSYLSGLAERQDAARPALTVGGKKVKRFDQNGVSWESQFWLPGHYIALFGYHESYHQTSIFAAIADTGGRFISGALEGLGRIVSYNALSQLIIWQNDTRYGVSSLYGAMLFPF